MRKDKILSFVTTGMAPESTVLSDISQTEKDKNYDLIHMWNRKQKGSKLTKPNQSKLRYRPQLVITKEEGVRTGGGETDQGGQICGTR